MTIIKQYFTFSVILLAMIILSSCEDFLDRVPESKVTPDAFFNSEADLATYSLGGYNFYGGRPWSWHPGDVNSDVFMYLRNTDGSDIWYPGMKRVSNGYGGWTFDKIRNSNYFFEQVLPKHRANRISGSASNVNHYIGEVYVNRAYVYFEKLQMYGDFPIITRTYADADPQLLIDANKRMPRNEVARFILADLDTALTLLNMTDKNRITRDAALLLRSRIALYEATWLKYHQGTPFVPGGPGWPGAPYHPDFTINIDAEIDFFLTEAMEAAKEVADKYSLTVNSHVMNPPLLGTGGGWNPYFEMYNSKDLTSFDEVLMWRDNDRSQGVYNTFGGMLIAGPGGGIYKGHIDSYLMQNGLPKYAAGSGFGLDSTIMLEKANRDERLQLFICGEKDVRYVNNRPQTNAYLAPSPVSGGALWGYPPITFGSNQVAFTGYMPRKYLPYEDLTDFGNADGEAGFPIFRVAEAYLNYIEASYLKEGTINGTAATYWRALRNRAGVDEDFQKTINNTDLSQEDDFAKYSGSTMVDATTYNIRRERSCEFLLEGLRWPDMKRWRALDMVQNYHQKGFNLWDNAYKHYTGQYALIEPGDGTSPNVSSQADGKYLLPFKKDANSLLYNGWNWTKAYYLEPIGFQAFLITTDDVTGNPQKTIYQNPYWPTESNGTASE